LKFDQRRCVRSRVAHSLDLLGKIIDSLAPTPTRGDERVCLGTDRIDEVHKARVLPRILRLAIRTKLPFGLVEVPELIAVRQLLSRLSHYVFDRLATVPFHPGGCGAESGEGGAFLDLGAFFALCPAPVAELEQGTLDYAFSIFGCSIAPAVIGLY